jgi:ABC-type glycerol-3-phosphate transport system substrate-binding protein
MGKGRIFLKDALSLARNRFAVCCRPDISGWRRSPRVKTGLVACLVAMAVMVVGCSTPPPVQAPGVTTVVVQMYSGQEADAMAKVVEEWNRRQAKDAGFEVSLETLPQDGYFERVVSQLAGRLGRPDIVHLVSLSLGRLEPYLEPAGSHVDPEGTRVATLLEALPAATTGSVRVDGRALMFPTGVHQLVMFYRSDLMEEPPATWNEALEVARNLTQRHNSDSPTEYGMAWPGRLDVWGFAAYLGILWSYGGDWRGPLGEVSLDQEEALESMKVLEDLYRQAVLPPGVENQGHEDVVEALREGRAAMGLAWSWAFDTLADREDSPGTWDKIEMAPPPGADEGEYTTRGMYLHTTGLAVNSASPYRSEAMSFLAWATLGEGARVYAQGGGDPLWAGQDLPGSLEMVYPWVMEYGRSPRPHPRLTEVMLAGSKWVRKVLVGEVGAAEACQGLQGEAQAITEPGR